MKKILLIGGTGAIGIYLIKACVNLGYKVYVTSRKKILNEENIIYLQGDAFDKDFLSQVLTSEHFDAVVDFLVYTTEQLKDRLDLLLNHAEQYVFISTYRVFANSDLIPITESSAKLLDTVTDAEYLKTDEYGLAKARQEYLLRNSKYKNWTIVRPSISYSTSRFQFGTLEADQFLRRTSERLPIIMSSDVLNKYTTMTWSGDVATMISKLLLNSKSYSDDFNVLTSEHHTWHDVSKLYAELIGLQVISVPTEEFAKVANNRWQLKYDRMFNRICDNSKILSFCGFKASDLTPLKKGLAVELSHTKLLENKSENFPTKYDGKVDKILNSYQTLFVKSSLSNKLRYLNGRLRKI